MTAVKSATNLENLFANLLKKPARDVAGLFEFFEDGGYVVAAQPRKTYLDQKEWMILFHAIKDLGGKVERDEAIGIWQFKVPKAAGPSDDKLQTAPKPEAPKQHPGPAKAPAAGQPTRQASKAPTVSRSVSEVPTETRQLKTPQASLQPDAAGAEAKTVPPPSSVQKWQPEYPPTDSPVKLGYYPEFPVDRILSPSFTFRHAIGEDIETLMAEIHAAGMIIEPLVSRPAKSLGYVELCCGERRLLAARQLGMKTVPMIVKELVDIEFDRIRLLENIARKDLTDMEKAHVLKYHLDQYPEEYPTQEALAQALGRTQGWVAQHLAMLPLEKDEIITRVIKPEKLTEKQAREILSTPLERRTEVAEKIAEHIETEGKVPSAREIHKIVRPEESIPRALIGRHGTESEQTVNRAGFEPVPLGEITVPLNKSVVLEALETDLFVRFPQGVDFASIRDALGECSTDRLSDLLIQLRDEGSIRYEKRLWLPKEEMPKEEFTRVNRESTVTFPAGAGREPEPTDTGCVFTCPECNGQYTILHWPDGHHSLQQLAFATGGSKDA